MPTNNLSVAQPRALPEPVPQTAPQAGTVTSTTNSPINGQTLTRVDIVQSLKLNSNLSKQQLRLIVDRFFEIIIDALEQDDQVSLSGLGKFLPVNRISRPGRNPKTGTYHLIPDHKTVVFRTGSRLKRRFDKTRLFPAIQKFQHESQTTTAHPDETPPSLLQHKA
ncbi:MAG: HU family DNA-binding protein [Gammaproteobacteria bacterium]